MPGIEQALSQIFGGVPQALIGSLGFALVVLAFWLAFRALRLADGELVTGKVVRWRRLRDSEGPDSFAPVVSFVPRGTTEPIEVQSQHDFRAEPGAIGEFMQIRYDPANPARAETASTGRQWFAVLCILVLGVGTLYTGWLIGGA